MVKDARSAERRKFVAVPEGVSLATMPKNERREWARDKPVVVRPKPQKLLGVVSVPDPGAGGTGTGRRSLGGRAK
jgi:hypothetical protein